MDVVGVSKVLGAVGGGAVVPMLGPCSSLV